MASRVVMSGAGVPAHILRVLPLVSAVRGTGPLSTQMEIRVGTIDRPANMMILGMVSGEVIYVRGIEMRAAPVGEFLQGYFLGQVTSEVYRRTAWIIPVSKVFTAFCIGLAIGFTGWVGVGANLVVVIVRISVFISGHPNEVQVVKETLPIAIRCLLWFRSNCPVLYSKMAAVVRRGLFEAIESAPSGITAEDIASVLGRVLGGLGAAPEVGLRVLMTVITKTVLVYSALHLAPAAVHGSAHHARRVADALVDELRQQGAAITPAEQGQILGEIVRAGVEAGTNIDQLNRALQRLSPALDRLAAAWGEEH